MGFSTDLAVKVITRPLYTNYSMWEAMGSLELGGTGILFGLHPSRLYAAQFGQV